MAETTLCARRARLKELLKDRCYLEGDFTLASGAKSGFFFDGKMALLDAEGINLVADSLLERLAGERIDAIGGLVVGACAMATGVSLKSAATRRPMSAFYVRKAQKDHGTQKQIEGPALHPGMRVVIVDDVATSGGSLLEAYHPVKALGCEVVKIMSVVDREQGARARIRAETGLELEALFTRSELEA